jgi:hypothetical protein
MTNREPKSVMSASHQTTMSPLATCNERHSASPLPLPPATWGRMSAASATRAPASAATSAVRSVEWSSMTSTSSTSGARSTRCRRSFRTTSPTVLASSCAGMQTETTWSPLASTNSLSGKSR